MLAPYRGANASEPSHTACLRDRDSTDSECPESGVRISRGRGRHHKVLHNTVTAPSGRVRVRVTPAFLGWPGIKATVRREGLSVRIWLVPPRPSAGPSRVKPPARSVGNRIEVSALTACVSPSLVVSGRRLRRGLSPVSSALGVAPPVRRHGLPSQPAAAPERCISALRADQKGPHTALLLGLPVLLGRAEFRHRGNHWLRQISRAPRGFAALAASADKNPLILLYWRRRLRL